MAHAIGGINIVQRQIGIIARHVLQIGACRGGERGHIREARFQLGQRFTRGRQFGETDVQHLVDIEARIAFPRLGDIKQEMMFQHLGPRRQPFGALAAVHGGDVHVLNAGQIGRHGSAFGSHAGGRPVRRARLPAAAPGAEFGPYAEQILITALPACWPGMGHAGTLCGRRRDGERHGQRRHGHSQQQFRVHLASPLASVQNFVPMPMKYWRPITSYSCGLVLESPPAAKPITGGWLSSTLLMPPKIAMFLVISTRAEMSQ